MGAIEVAGLDEGIQAVGRVVGDMHGFGIVAEADQDTTGPNVSVWASAERVVDFAENGRLDEVTAGEVAADAVPPASNSPELSR